MKKIILVLMMGIVLSGTAMAQKSIKFLPKAGINYSYYNDNFDAEEIEGKTGYQIGLDVRFGEKLYVSPGIHFIEQKDKLVTVGDAVNVEPLDAEFRTKGLRVPLVVGGDLIGDERFGIRAYAGPAMTVLLTEDNVISSFNDWTQKDILWGADLGVGFDIGFITIDLVHEWGLNDSIRFDSANAKNRTFLLSVGLMF